MRLAWRAALAFAANGWPVVPWDSHPLEPFASFETKVVEDWAHQYPTANAAVDLAAAGLFVLEVEGSGPESAGYRSLSNLFTNHDWWPEPDVLSVATPCGGWQLYLWQSKPPVAGRLLAPGVRIETQFVLVPGSTDPSVADSGPWAEGVYRLEHGADLVPARCPDWLAPVAHT